MTLRDITDESKCCCSCSHNKRTGEPTSNITCHCDIDGHYIGYVANFESVCEEWEGDAAPQRKKNGTIITEET